MDKVSFNSVYLGFAPACTPTQGGGRGWREGNPGRPGQRGLSKEARWPRAHLLSKAQEAHLHFYSVRLAWGRNTQRLATPESAGSQRHCPVGCQQSLAAWGEGQKPAMPAGSLSFFPLSSFLFLLGGEMVQVKLELVHPFFVNHYQVASGSH